MAQGYRYEASWGGIRIDVTSTSTQHGRSVFAHRFPRKDGASTEDQGREPLEITLEFVFFDRDPLAGETLPLGDFQERFESFLDLMQEDPVRTLIHPYYGSRLCRISNFSTQGDADGSAMITCTADFTEESGEPATYDFTTGALTATAGEQLVTFAARATDLILEELGLSSDLPSEASDIVLNWSLDLTLTARAVQLQMAEFNSRLQVELAAFETAGDPDLAPVMQAYTVLQWRMRLAAESYSSTTPRIVEITPIEGVPLRVLAAKFYGADEAERRFEELLELNPQLGTPACVPGGFTLKAYSRTVRPGEYRRG